MFLCSNAMERVRERKKRCGVWYFSQNLNILEGGCMGEVICRMDMKELKDAIQSVIPCSVDFYVEM